jgi:hypothetical protein
MPASPASPRITACTQVLHGSLLANWDAGRARLGGGKSGGEHSHHNFIARTPL